jgi:hypothetical protein
MMNRARERSTWYTCERGVDTCPFFSTGGMITGVVTEEQD